MTVPLLEVANLHVHAGEHVLLRDCHFTLAPGELVGVIGPNGAGKSSLLKALAGLLPAARGSIVVMGSPLASLEPRARAERLAYLEQQPQACWPLRVTDIVALGLSHRGTGGTRLRQRIDAALDASGCPGLHDRHFHTLSAGEQMQVHLARVLVADTPIVLADEPTAALDLWHQHHLLQVLRQQCEAGKGMVVVMHDLALAARYCTRLMLFDRGELVVDGSAAEVLDPPLLARCYRVRARFDAERGSLQYEGNLAEAPSSHASGEPRE